jgi:peptidoglycan glycosyltransferase
VSTWLDPWKDPNGDSFQIVKGWFAMANGGLTGTGLGLGNQQRIPFIESDFIFVAVAQELGLFGATLVLAAYLLMFGSGLRIAARSEHAFDKLLAVGLSTLLGVQAFIIIGGIVRVLPLTGVTLPFIAYGGSSLVSSWIILAMLLRISDETHRRAAEKMAMAVA